LIPLIWDEYQRLCLFDEYCPADYNKVILFFMGWGMMPITSFSVCVGKNEENLDHPRRIKAGDV
jgi:hypothetical protein